MQASPRYPLPSILLASLASHSQSQILHFHITQRRALSDPAHSPQRSMWCSTPNPHHCIFLTLHNFRTLQKPPKPERLSSKYQISIVLHLHISTFSPLPKTNTLPTILFQAMAWHCCRSKKEICRYRVRIYGPHCPYCQHGRCGECADAEGWRGGFVARFMEEMKATGEEAVRGVSRG